MYDQFARVRALLISPILSSTEGRLRVRSGYAFGMENSIRASATDTLTCSLVAGQRRTKGVGSSSDTRSNSARDHALMIESAPAWV